MHTNNIKQAKYIVFMYLGVCVFSLCVYVCEWVSENNVRRREQEFRRE